ncbi:hypothetical protein PtA15_3A513 [Puccinia triticina]|uniref:Transcription initiation factor IIB n=1 Tax=Puccinia triticina TaxID=208348 RepID=A0ABY7CD40_9BASI|nr:uncharacterized protein PtA15_3A513 [Puccinia triticina]WAQ83146.1 hypothetical protein PtA15_3A513 [Puccinia triticina]
MATIAFPSRNPQAPKEAAFRQDLNVRLICPDCKCARLVEEFSSGDLVCGSCGLVVGDRIVDTRSEWRTFAGDEGDDPSRVGGPSNPLLNGVETFETVISFKDGNTGVARDLNRAATRAAVKSGEKSIAAAFISIQDMCDTISLPRTVTDIAKQLYRRADEEKLLRGKQADAVIAACIFIACRQSKVGRSFKEVVALTRVPKKQIGQCFKALSAAFETSAVGGGGALNTATGESSGAGAEDLTARFCSHLGLPFYVQSGAKRIAILQRDLGILAGRSPISVASACIYFASHLYGCPKSAKDIAGVAGVSETTIKIAYRLLHPKHKEICGIEATTNEAASIDRLPKP